MDLGQSRQTRLVGAWHVHAHVAVSPREILSEPHTSSLLQAISLINAEVLRQLVYPDNDNSIGVTVSPPRRLDPCAYEATSRLAFDSTRAFGAQSRRLGPGATATGLMGS